MNNKFYLNGEEVTAPVLTTLEKKLAEKLSKEDFGDDDASGYITMCDGEWVKNAGLERVNQIKWQGGRQQLGALITSLQEKKLITVDDPEDGHGLEMWFDCDALELLSR